MEPSKPIYGGTCPPLRNSRHSPGLTNILPPTTTRNPEYLAQSLKDAKAGGYGIGIKLVRGAYQPQETAAHASSSSVSDESQAQRSLSISPDPLPPVWSTKSETDKCFNDAARILVSAVREDIEITRKKGWTGGGGVPRVAVMFGTHNKDSCEIVLDAMVQEGLAAKGAAGDGKEVVKIGDEVARRVTLAQLYGAF